MSDDHDSPYANSPYHDQRYSDSGREGFERDAYQRDSALDGRDYGYGPVRGWTWLSWFAILLLVVFIVSLRDAKRPQGIELPPLDDSPASMQGLVEFQGRFIVGMGELLRQVPGHDPKELIEGDPTDAANKDERLMIYAKGNFGQRLQNVIVVGDVSGPDNAIKLLSLLNLQLNEERLVPSGEQRALQLSLGKLYRDYQQQKFDAPSLKEPERQRILSKLEWHGRLALTPPLAPDQVAREAVIRGPFQLAIGLCGVIGGVLVLAVAGLLGYLGLGFGTLTGAVKFGIRPVSPSSGVYAETFALWLFGFTGSQIAAMYWPWPQTQFVLLLAIMFGSLLVLLWPVLRGIPFYKVRQDLGLSWGRGGILEPFMGVPGYCLMLPMLVVGATITIVIMMVTVMNQVPNPQGPDSSFQAINSVPHPAVIEFLRGDRWVQLQLVLLACVAAPIVEEIMFRGVLYRHLRDATRGFGWLISGVFSAVWMSFVFAVIHPQPAYAIPALMGIACGCTLVREWRDSLWASMVVHALSNGLVFTILWLGSQ